MWKQLEAERDPLYKNIQKSFHGGLEPSLSCGIKIQVNGEDQEGCFAGERQARRDF